MFLRQRWKQKPRQYGPFSRVQSSLFQNTEGMGIDPDSIALAMPCWGPGDQNNYGQNNSIAVNNGAIYDRGVLVFNGAETLDVLVPPAQVGVSLFIDLSNIVKDISYSGLVGHFNGSSNSYSDRAWMYTHYGELWYRFETSIGVSNAATYGGYEKSKWGLTWDGSTIEHIVNSNRMGENAYANTIPSGTTPQKIGHASGYLYADINSMLQFSVAIPADKLVEISENPWKLWQRVAPVSYFLPSGVAGLLSADLSWKIRTVKESDTAWRTLNQASTDSAWKLLTESTVDSEWKVLTELSESAAWKILNSEDADVSWKVLRSDSANTAWNIRTETNQDSSWKIKNESEKDVSWKIITKIDQDTAWKILTSGILLQDTSWRILTDKSAVTGWRIKEVETAETAWKIATQTEQDTAWNIKTETKQDTSWRIMTGTFLEQDISWKILRVDDQDLEWRIKEQAEKDTAWKIFTKSDQDTSWSILTDDIPDALHVFTKEARTFLFNKKARTFIFFK